MPCPRHTGGSAHYAQPAAYQKPDYRSTHLPDDQTTEYATLPGFTMKYVITNTNDND